MIGYLIRAIIQLAIFLGVIYIMPYATFIAIMVFILVAGIKFISSEDYFPQVHVGVTAAFLIIGFGGMYWAITLLQKAIQNEIFFKLLLMAGYCIPPVFGGYISRHFVRADRRDYYMNEYFDTFTAPYPFLLMATGIVRFVIEVLYVIPSDAIASYTNLLDLGVQLGNTAFSVAIGMYIVRSAHVFWVNR